MVKITGKYFVNYFFSIGAKMFHLVQVCMIYVYIMISLTLQRFVNILILDS